MTETPQPIDTQRIAQEAALLQNNTAFKQAMTTVRGVYTKAMIETDIDERDRRDHFHRCIRALDDVESALTVFISTGTLETAMLVKQEKAKK